MSRAPDSLIPVLEIGGTHVTAGLVAVSSAGTAVVARNRLLVEATGASAALIKTFVAAGRTLATHDSDTTWGVAIPGPFDYERGVAHFTGVAKFDALNGVDLGDALKRALAPQMKGVVFVNDATAFGLGEHSTGAGSTHQRVMYLTLGTGIGSAFIADGVPVDTGPQVPDRGWAYLLEWEGKPLEDTVSRRAIRGAYEARTGELLDVHEIAERARGGDRPASDVLIAAMTALGRAMGRWVRSFDATAVVIGGSIAASWDLLGDAIGKSLRDASARPNLDLMLARLGDDAALIGAAEAAILAAAPL